MSDELAQIAPQIVITSQTEVVAEALEPGIVLETPPAEEVRAAEAVFSQDDESHLVAGIMGMWTGTLLMHDLAIEHFSTPKEEKLPKRTRDEEDEENEDDS